MKIKLNKKGQAGLTLIEVTLVIAVLLGLISVLFIGVAAYKKGSDRAKCILNISTVQKAVRSYANMYEKDTGATIATADYIGAGLFIENLPTCPTTTGVYTYQTTIPSAGTAMVDCSLSGGTTLHVPSSLAGW